MAPTCCQPIVDRYRYRPIFKLGSQPPKSPASLDAIALGCAARFNLSKLDESASMDGRRFQGPPAVGQFLSSGCMADLSEDGEIFDSDDDGLPFPREIPTPLEQVVDLITDDDGGGDRQ